MACYKLTLNLLKKSVLLIPSVISSIIGAVLLLIVFPSLSLFLAIYKLCVILIAKLKFPDAKPLGALSSLLANGEISRASHAYLSLKIIIEGRVSINTVREEWIEKVMKKRYANGKLQFPELQNYIRKFMGYHFWLWDKNFDIEHHIQLYRETNEGTEEFIDKEKLVELRTDFQRRVFKNCRSPWEMLLVNNYSHDKEKIDKEHSVLIFKFHHSLADGFSIVKLFWTHLGGAPMHTFDKKEKTPGNIKSKCKTLAHFLMLPIFMANLLLQFPINFVCNRKRLFDRHPWHLPPKKLSGKYHLWISEPVNKKQFKEIKEAHNVSILSVLIATLVGAARKMMKTTDLKLPKDINVLFPLPLPKHPDFLTNHLTVAEVKIPFSNPDPLERLLQINRNIKNEVTRGTFPIFFRTLVPFLAAYPYWFNNLISYYMCCSLIILSVPLPRGEMHYFGNKAVCLDSVFYAARVGCGVTVSVMGYNDHFYMSLQIDTNLLTHQDEVRDFEKYILEELESIAEAGV